MYDTIRRSINMGKNSISKNNGIQTDLWGNPVHILNVAGIYRMVKCGKCGRTVKSGQAKLHLSFGKSLSVCNECMENMDNQRSVKSGIIIGPSKISKTIESYGMDAVNI